MTTIHEALANVMADCTHVAKRDVNQHQRFYFRGIDAVVNAVGPILRQHGVIVMPTVKSVTYDDVKTSTGKGATACRVIVDYTFWSTDGTSVVATVAAEAWDAADKAAPKAMSVAFRTALLQALALPTDEPDPDSYSHEGQPAAQTAAAPTQRMSRAARKKPEGEPEATDAPQDGGDTITQAQMRAMQASFKDLGITDPEGKRAYCSDKAGRPITSATLLTPAEASRVIDALHEDAKGPAETR